MNNTLLKHGADNTYSMDNHAYSTIVPFKTMLLVLKCMQYAVCTQTAGTRHTILPRVVTGGRVGVGNVTSAHIQGETDYQKIP